MVVKYDGKEYGWIRWVRMDKIKMIEIYWI